MQNPWRNLPDIELSPCPKEYATLLAHRWDSIQEAYELVPTPEFIAVLERAQALAKERDEAKGVAVIELRGHEFKVRALGAKRYRWVFENDDFMVLVGVPALGWAVSVRYLSAGLWEHGWKNLREFVFELLRPYTTQQNIDCVRVSRADYCFDFYAPTLKNEIVPGTVVNFVAHSSVKKFETQTVGIGSRAQTVTIGSRASLQTQFYDKTLEITEQSGKTWLYPIWIRQLGYDPWHGSRPRDVWRWENRFFSEFLKQRNCRRPHEVETAREYLLTEALFRRRWVVPQANDSHRQRWPMHPIPSEAYRHCGGPEMLPIGPQLTERPDVIARRFSKQISGLVRSAAVLSLGDYNAERARQIVEFAQAQITRDPKHAAKVAAAQDRYSGAAEAR